jgi:hypothetical protein
MCQGKFCTGREVEEIPKPRRHDLLVVNTFFFQNTHQMERLVERYNDVKKLNEDEHNSWRRACHLKILDLDKWIATIVMATKEDGGGSE